MNIHGAPTHDHIRGPEGFCLSCRMMMWEKPEPTPHEDFVMPLGEYPALKMDLYLKGSEVTKVWRLTF